MPPQAVPLNFDNAEYYELNADLGRALPHTFYHAIRHYLEHGIRERRRHSYAQCYIDPPWRQAPDAGPAAPPEVSAPPRRIAWLVRVDCPAACAAIVRRIAGLDLPHDIILNVSERYWSEELHARLRADAPDAGIVVSDGDAGDIRRHFDSVAGLQLKDYAAVLMVHAHDSSGAQDLSALLAGAEGSARHLRLLATDETIGIIAPAPSDADAPDARSLRAPMLVRAEVLQRMHEILNGAHPDGTDRQPADTRLADRPDHATEDLIANVCESIGYRIHWH
jgi:hypothetical protein